jgi:small subunit ribosomal protein S7
MRKKRNYKREHKPDLKYGSVTISRFINYLMEDGKKRTAEKIMYDALENLKKETGEEPLKVFEKALENVSPMVEVTIRCLGKSGRKGNLCWQSAG